MSEPDTAPQVSLITPMYNEANRIQTNVSKILKAMETLCVSWEYILVDDGSTDDSLAKAEEVLKNEPRCRIIHYSRNRGRGYALRQGFAAVRGRYVITTESDLSWGTEIVAKLYHALKTRGSDMVIASVNLPGGGLENVPTFRRLLSRGGNLIMRWMFYGNLTMLSGMTRGYRRHVIDSLHLEENDKEIHLEIVNKARALGYTVVEIPATIRWENPEKADRKLKRPGISRFIIPHIIICLHVGSIRFLAWASIGIGLIGMLLTLAGVLNKLFHVLPVSLPYLVTYGLLLLLLSILCGMFGLMSIELGFVYRSLIHIQAQLKALRQSADPEPPRDSISGSRK